jgi:hypothetical protein
MLDGLRVGFFVAIVICLMLLIVIPAPSARITFGVLLVGLATIYTLVEHGLASLAAEADSGAEPAYVDWKRRGKREKRDKKKRKQMRFQANTDALDERLRRLRRAYYQADPGGVASRAARREMERISEACRLYFERMLQTEASVLTLLNTGPVRGLEPDELIYQVQALSRRIALMVEQIQLADQLNGFYSPGTDEAIMVGRSRERLIQRADRALEVLEGVPARLLQLTTATSHRGLTPLVDDLRRMTARLEGKAQAYEAMTDELDLEHLYAVYEARTQAEQAHHD